MQSCVEVVEYVEFWCGDAKICSSYWMKTLGFNHIAVKGMRTGDRMRSTHVVSQGETTILFTSSTNSEDKEFYEHQRIHGDAVKDIALRVSNVDDVFQKAVSNGAIPIQSPHSIRDDKGTVRIAKIGTPFGDVVHTLLDKSQYHGIFLPGFIEDKKYSKSASITYIDHIAMAYQKEKAHSAMAFYKNCLGFEQFLCNDDDTEQGLTILGKDDVEGGLRTIVAACNSQKFCFKFVLVEAIEGSEQNQVQEFLEFNGGHGVQHIALHSKDIFHTVSTLKSEGLEFLKVPPGYYQKLFESPDSFMSEHRDQMEDLGLLLDVSEAKRNLQNGEDPHFFVQCFTLPIQDRPTFFLEIIQRKGSSGFGKRTIKALFEAIEKQRRLRDHTS